MQSGQKFANLLVLSMINVNAITIKDIEHVGGYWRCGLTEIYNG